MPPTPPPHVAHSVTRRLALGACVVGASLYSSSSSSNNHRISSASSSPSQRAVVASMSSGSKHATSSQGEARVAPASPAPSAPSSSSSTVKIKGAVNLRDIGEIDGRLKRGVLYRCSQVYTPDVLRELKIRTVVDLRGRAERGKKKGAAAAATSSKPAAAQGSGGMGPPPLFNPQQVSALGAAQGDQIQGQLRSGGGPAADSGGGPDVVEGGPELDFSVTKLRRQGSAAGSMEGSVSEEDNGSSTNGGVRLRGNTEEAAAALGSPADWQLPETEAFNVIPTKQFGYAMLRMPLRVWRGAFGNLLSGRDPRKPFVDAFADEQLLGFFRYYKIILEHSKSNIAAVLRVFAKDASYPSLVHCAHGKDRTGVIIMLLLLLCDTPHEAIVADYVQSEVELRKYRESLGLADPTGATGAVIPLNEVIIASTQETLRALLAYMDATYLTVDNYLASCGLTQQEVAAIRRNLLRPEALTADGMPAPAAAAAAEPAGSA